MMMKKKKGRAMTKKKVGPVSMLMKTVMPVTSIVTLMEEALALQVARGLTGTTDRKEEQEEEEDQLRSPGSRSRVHCCPE